MNQNEAKFKACEELSKKTTITKTQILSTANKFNLPIGTLSRAWSNFVQSAGKTVDFRIKSGKYVGKEQFFKNENIPTKIRVFTIQKAASILIEYITTKIGYNEICKKYNFSPVQLHMWISNIEFKGVFYEKEILDYGVFPKINISNVIWLNKYPNTKRKSIKNLTESERAAYIYCCAYIVKMLSNLTEEK